MLWIRARLALPCLTIDLTASYRNAMIIADSDSGTAMTLGQTYLTTSGTPRALSRHGLDFLGA